MGGGDLGLRRRYIEGLTPEEPGDPGDDADIGLPRLRACVMEERLNRENDVGIWDFVKDAGKKLGIGTAEAAEGPAPEALKKEVEDLGLKTEGLEIAVEGDKVKVKGHARDRAEKEKVILAVGNVAGVAKVEEEIETPEPAGEPRFYTVVEGDTLWKIAEKHMGKGERYSQIFEANRPMLSDPDKIYPGQVLRIPAE
jgi:nucleoid-associated protein YgaU